MHLQSCVRTAGSRPRCEGHGTGTAPATAGEACVKAAPDRAAATLSNHDPIDASFDLAARLLSTHPGPDQWDHIVTVALASAGKVRDAEDAFRFTMRARAFEGALQHEIARYWTPPTIDRLKDIEVAITGALRTVVDAVPGGTPHELLETAGRILSTHPHPQQWHLVGDLVGKALANARTEEELVAFSGGAREVKGALVAEISGWWTPPRADVVDRIEGYITSAHARLAAAAAK